MKINSSEITNCKLKIDIFISEDEFNRARKRAYISNSDRYPVPGVAESLATLAELRKIYGPAVLYDEALEIVIPESFNSYLKDKSIRIIGKPEVEDVAFDDTGGVNFIVSAELYPKVVLGDYLGIKVPFEREDAHFEEAVLQASCQHMNCDIPKHMVENKLDSMYAQEKLRVVNDAIYHVLADCVAILRQAYRDAGISRGMTQIRAEAMDVMLQTVSGDNKQVSKEFFKEQIRALVKRYRTLPDDFDELLEKSVNDRMEEKKSAKPEEIMDEVFKAYLGSLELDELQWRKERKQQAVKAVCYDMLLDAVAEAENLALSETEIERSIISLAGQYNMDESELRQRIDIEPLKWQLLRDKAKELILSNAKYDDKVELAQLV